MKKEPIEKKILDLYDITNDMSITTKIVILFDLAVMDRVNKCPSNYEALKTYLLQRKKEDQELFTIDGSDLAAIIDKQNK